MSSGSQKFFSSCLGSENLYEYPKWDFNTGTVLYKTKYYKYHVKPYHAIRSPRIPVMNECYIKKELLYSSKQALFKLAAM